MDALVGFRGWKVSADLDLLPMWQSQGRDAWRPGESARAHCFAMMAPTVMWVTDPAARKERHTEPAPRADCFCGFHAWYAPEPRDLNSSSLNVWGMIVAWGTVEEHELGFRAQYARVVGLASGVERTSLTVGDVADRYDVPCLPLDELALYGQMFGQIAA